jgi:hypothetical protein
MRLLSLAALLAAIAVFGFGDAPAAAASMHGSFDSFVTACEQTGEVAEDGDPEHRWCNGFSAVDCYTVAVEQLDAACQDYCCAGVIGTYFAGTNDETGFCVCFPCGEGEIDPTGQCIYW